MVGRNEFDDNADDEIMMMTTTMTTTTMMMTMLEREMKMQKAKIKTKKPVPAPKPPDDGDANADDEMLQMNYWDDDNPWSRGQVQGASKKGHPRRVEGWSRWSRGPGTRGGLNPGRPGGEGGSDWKVSGFPTVLVPAYSLLKQEQLQLAQASFRNIGLFQCGEN